MQVGVLGFGAIGSRVARALAQGEVPGAQLVGVHTRTPGAPRSNGFAELAEEELISRTNLVVEAAGVCAAATIGPRVMSAGKNLLLTSVGALADPRTRGALLEVGPGRTYLTSGAIGGLDVLSAAARAGGIETVSLTTTKTPSAVVGPWLEDSARRRILGVEEPMTVFEGTVHDAIEQFPASLNVAVALAAATGLWERTTVRFIADPDASLTRHEIAASGTAGVYRFSIQNSPEPDNPASSGVVADAVINGIATLVGVPGAIV